MTRWITLPLCFLTTAALADTARQAAPPRSDVKPAGYSGLGAESLSPQDVAKYAAPALDDRVSRRIQAMLDVRGIEKYLQGK
jgi:hypothetical protein